MIIFISKSLFVLLHCFPEIINAHLYLHYIESSDSSWNDQSMNRENNQQLFELLIISVVCQAKNNETMLQILRLKSELHF